MTHISGPAFRSLMSRLNKLLAARLRARISSTFLEGCRRYGAKHGHLTAAQAEIIDAVWAEFTAPKVSGELTNRERGMRGRRSTSARAREREIPTIEQLLRS